MAGDGLTRRGFLGWAAATAAVASGMACSSGDDGSADAGAGEAGETGKSGKGRKARADRPGGGERTLRLAQVTHFVPSYDTWFDNEYARRWGEANDVEVLVDHIPLADLATRAGTEVATRRGHDLFSFPSPPPAFEDDVIDLRAVVEEVGAKLGSMTPLLERSAFNPKTKKWFGFPEYWSANVINYRSDLWAAVGRPAGPDTWEDLVRAGPALKAAGHPLGLGLSPDFDANTTLLSLLGAYGASVQDAEARVVLDSPAAVEAVKVGVAIYQGGMTDEVFTWDAASNNRFLVSGRGSLIFNPVSGLRAFEQQDPALAGKVRLAPPLAGPAGRFGHPSFLGVSVIWDFAEHQALARRFLVDLALAYQDAFVQSGFYNIPSFPAAAPALGRLVADDTTADPPGKYALLGQATEWSVNVGHPGSANAAVDEVFNSFLVPKMFAAAARGELTAEDAVARAEAEMQPIFERWRERGKI